MIISKQSWEKEDQGSFWVMAAEQQVLAKWLNSLPDFIIARGRNMNNWKNTLLKNEMLKFS